MSKKNLFKKLIVGISLTVGSFIQSGYAMEDSARGEAGTFNPILQFAGVFNIITNYVDIRSMEALACCSEGLREACMPKIQAIHLRLSQGFNWSQGSYLSAAEEGHGLSCVEAEEEYLSFKNSHYSCVRVLAEPCHVIFPGELWLGLREVNTEVLFIDRDGFFDLDTFLRYSGFRHAEYTAKHAISIAYLDQGGNALEALLKKSFLSGSQNHRCFYQTRWFQPDSSWIGKITKAKFTPQMMGGELPICMSQLRNLRDLRASHIAWVHPWIGNLRLLERLTLVNSCISEIPETFRSLYSLRVLDLRSNLLRKLPDVFEGLHSLEELFLQQNRLTKLPAGMRELRSLKVLDLSDNQLEDVPVTKLPAGGAGELRFKILGLSDDRLEDVPDIFTQPSGMFQSLEMLNLAGNPCLESDREGLIRIAELSSFWSADNKLNLDQTSSLTALRAVENRLVALRALANRLFEW
jgi:hypothetical protein